ncbi:MAG: CYTH domain-containing protein [Ignavibacteriales bacterium]|nr:CYTH domain-containing protein [Ignavibacteriales bacterium]
MEIERKFLVRALPPDLEGYPKSDIEQGYLAVEGETGEVRLRRRDDEYYVTYKSGGGARRVELETSLRAEQFDALWEGTAGKRIAKTRYVIPYGDYAIELDVYRGAHEGLLTAEIEFPSLEEARQAKLPEWFGEDVTEDNRYRNFALATGRGGV